MREHLRRWLGWVPLASSLTTVVVVGVLLVLESLLVLSLLEEPDLDRGTSTQGTWVEPAQVHVMFAIAWVVLHPLLMRKPMRYGLRVFLACVLWVACALVWVSFAAYSSREAAEVAEVHPFAWVFWSAIILAAVSPAVVVGAFVGEKLTGVVEAQVTGLLEDREDREPRTDQPPSA